MRKHNDEKKVDHSPLRGSNNLMAFGSLDKYFRDTNGSFCILIDLVRLNEQKHHRLKFFLHLCVSVEREN